MTIRLELNTTRKKNDGTYPICVKIQDGNKKKRISTGIDCNRECWDKNHITEMDSNHRYKNDVINNIYEKYKKRFDLIRSKNIKPTIDLILSDIPPVTDEINLLDIINEIINNTVHNKNYTFIKGLLERYYGNYISLSSYNSQGWFDDFANRMIEQYTEEKYGIINRMLTLVGSTIFKYIQKKGYIDYPKFKTQHLRVKQPNNTIKVQSGIYMWTLKDTGECYIGQATDLHARVKKFIRFNKPYAGDIINEKRTKYPSLSYWNYDILEECDVKDLDLNEQKWIKKIPSEKCLNIKNI